MTRAASRCRWIRIIPSAWSRTRKRIKTTINLPASNLYLNDNPVNGVDVAEEILASRYDEILHSEEQRPWVTTMNRYIKRLLKVFSRQGQNLLEILRSR